MEKLKKFLSKVWNLIPAIIGILEVAVPLVKELCVTLARLIAVIPLFWTDPQPTIDKINEVYEKIMEWVEKIKNAILFI